jgi:GntR family transcriptional regulator, transcriptional repressor for pyruvate dehydrogenase complex
MKQTHLQRANLGLVASRLRKRILEIDEENVFLGSEQKLMQDMDVSRPTFRQAARLLEQEQLLAIKRGPGGGFFTRRPSFEGVAHLMSICMVSRKAKLIHMFQAAHSLSIETARLAAASRDSDKRQEPLRLLEQYANIDVQNKKEIAQLAIALQESITRIADNPILHVFLQVVLEFAGYFNTMHSATPKHVKHYLEIQKDLALAISNGDAEVAAIHANRLNKEYAKWTTAETVNSAYIALRKSKEND